MIKLIEKIEGESKLHFSFKNKNINKILEDKNSFDKVVQ